jgi:Flavin containing amine oxidoreductase
VVRGDAVALLAGRAVHLWPNAYRSGHFDWSLLCGAGGLEGEARVDSQHWSATVDPSDRYVQSLPGTGTCRLRADESGVGNLALAGDWTNCGLNAGCLEAAVMSGLQAANVVTGDRLTAGLLGSWYGLPS